MTTEPAQPTLPTFLEAEVEIYQAALEIHLKRLRAWGHLPDNRTDWALEALLDDIGRAALALRRLRNERDLPF